jgi:hypothetical protein
MMLPGRQALTFSADGKRALVGGRNGELVLWRVPTQSTNGR